MSFEHLFPVFFLLYLAIDDSSEVVSVSSQLDLVWLLTGLVEVLVFVATWNYSDEESVWLLGTRGLAILHLLRRYHLLLHARGSDHRG